MGSVMEKLDENIMGHARMVIECMLQNFISLDMPISSYNAKNDNHAWIALHKMKVTEQSPNNHSCNLTQDLGRPLQLRESSLIVLLRLMILASTMSIMNKTKYLLHVA